jgi:tRNA(Ile)-lysidine synthase
LRAAVRARLDEAGATRATVFSDARPHERPAVRVAVAFSGGRDSVALLDALATLAASLGIAVSAIHVHHGLSPNADAWAEFCARTCATLGVPLAIRRVEVRRAASESPEAAARTARYAAFAQVDVDFVALAHHADDQAETVLLQLLRGAGPRGLAAMPLVRAARAGPTLVRPLLALPRRAIAAYVAARGLAWVDDESNTDRGPKRNFLRHEIVPRLAAAFPGYPATIARGAGLQAEAIELADALAALDATGQVLQDPVGGASLDRAALAALAARAPARARNLLRWYLREAGLPAPSSARLAAMLDQFVRAPADARVRFAHAGVELGIHRGRIVAHATAVAPYAIAWQGEASLALPHGTLEFASRVGAGIAAAMLGERGLTVRPRTGGERIRLVAGGPSRSLKHLLHGAGIAPWDRASYPLVYRGDALVAVPGVGVDASHQAASGAIGYEARWRPMPAAR